MERLNRDQIAADWAARGFTCELWTDPPSQRWEDFVHDADELVVVLEGQMEFEVDGQVHRPRAGEEVLIPARASREPAKFCMACNLLMVKVATLSSLVAGRFRSR